MNITRSETRTIAQFRAKMYKHVGQAAYKTCWKCNRAFAIGEPVNICLTRGHGNFAICTGCASDAGLLDKVDERGFVSFEDGV